MDENLHTENETALCDVPVSVPEKRKYSPNEKLFAWLCVVLGFFFCKVFPMSKTPLGAAIFLVALFAVSFFFILRGRLRFAAVQKLVLISAGLGIVSALLWADRGCAFLCFCYALAAYAYLVYAGTGNTLEGGLSDLIRADLFRAIISYPFSAFAKLFPALFSPSAERGGKGVNRTVLKVLLGLAIAVLPTALVISLLSFDSDFTAILDGLFHYDSEVMSKNVVCFILGVPVAMYLFGLYFKSVEPGSDKGGARPIREREERMRVLPSVTAAAAVLPLLFVYAVFFISQWGYYTSAFTGVLPEGFSYAEYAREGFFQLCAVAVVDFLIVLGINVFMKRGGELMKKILCTVLVLVTLVLIATAMSKLVLYIAQYGLTRDRLHAGWFMLLLTLLFLIAAIRQFAGSFKAFGTGLALTVVMFLALCLCGSSRLIAKYNVDRYMSGSLACIDVYTLNDLGDDAIPEMLRLERYMAENDRRTREEAGEYSDPEHRALVNYLRSRAGKSKGLFEYTLSSLRAESLLRAWEEEDEIKVVIHLDLDEGIGLFLVDYDADGAEGTGGMSNADKSTIKRDDVLYWSLDRRCLDNAADGVKLVLKFSVVSQYFDPNYDNVYPEEYVIDAGSVSFDAAFGGTYSVTITGGRESGYRAVLN